MPPSSQTTCLRSLAALSALGLLLLLFVGALVATGQRFGGFGLGVGAPHPQHTATPRPTPTPVCALPAVDPTAARALKNVQLATGVQNAGTKDLRPINNVSTFVVGQTPFATFQVASNQAGTIGATFCVNGTNITGSPLTVPPGYLNARGEFHLPNPLSLANVGPGALALTWNGAVAAVLPFTVHAH